MKRKKPKGAGVELRNARTRTALIGATIYQPDFAPSAKGRRLLNALRQLSRPKPKCSPSA